MSSEENMWEFLKLAMCGLEKRYDVDCIVTVILFAKTDLVHRLTVTSPAGGLWATSGNLRDILEFACLLQDTLKGDKDE